jgi:hypothetical protein
LGPGIYDNAILPSKVTSFSMEKSTGRIEKKRESAMLEHLADEKSIAVGKHGGTLIGLEVTELIWVAQMRQRLGRCGVAPDQLSRPDTFKAFRATLGKTDARKIHANAYGPDASIQNLLDDYVNNKTVAEDNMEPTNIASDGSRQQIDRRRNKYDQVSCYFPFPHV